MWGDAKLVVQMQRKLSLYFLGFSKLPLDITMVPLFLLVEVLTVSRNYVVHHILLYVYCMLLYILKYAGAR